MSQRKGIKSKGLVNFPNDWQKTGAAKAKTATFGLSCRGMTN
jgi:hypothetical protein